MRYVLAAFLLAAPAVLVAQQTFPTPEAAAQSLIKAAAHNDTAALTAIFGQRGVEELSSGSKAQDDGERMEFARLAERKHVVQPDSRNPNRVLLCIGDENWPLPVPIVRTNQGWQFDADAGAQEMRARRIGGAELDAIEICAGYVQAQHAYADRLRDEHKFVQYARNLAPPLIPAQFAQALSENKPYHGYYFRALQGQGPNAPGGQHAYEMKNGLTAGFGLVAWPAEYGVTGIHTFIVNQDGTIFEKDLGPESNATTPPVTQYDPDRTWTRID